MGSPEQASGLNAKGHGLAHLLDYPSHRRMSGHHHVDHLTRGVIEDHKDIQDLKTNCGHSEKIHSPGDIGVIAQEGQPVPGLLSASLLGLTVYLRIVSGQGGSKPGSTKCSMKFGG